MKKLTASIFATLLAVVSVDAAQASIASKGYVDDQVGAVSKTVATKADQSTVDTLSGKVTANENAIGQINTTIGKYGDIVTHNTAEFATAEQGALADTALQEADLADYAKTADVANTYETKANATATYATKTALSDGLALKANTADLGALATKDTVSAAEIDANAVTTAKIMDANVTKAKLASDVQTSLGKADTALQSADLDGYATSEDLTSGLATKQNTLTAEQLNAVNSGITTEKVATYDGYATQIAAKANTADLGALATMDAVGSAQITDGSITSTDISATAAIKKTQLETGVQTSLGLADTALQQADLADYAKTADVASTYETKTNAANTYATKTALSDGLALKANTADLGDLATKDTVSAAEIDANAITTAKIVDANVTKAKLASDVQASLGKADTALQSADLDGYATSEEVAATYETKTNAQATYETKTNAQATYETKTNAANTYIPKVNAEGGDGVYVLTATAINGSATYKWEQIQRGTDGE